MADTATAEQAAGKTKRPSVPKIQLTNVPPELMDKLKATAEEGKTTVPRLVLQHMADTYGITLPPITHSRARKYASDEERKAAQSAARKNKTAAVAKLVELAQAGQIELSPEIKSLLGL